MRARVDAAEAVRRISTYREEVREVMLAFEAASVEAKALRPRLEQADATMRAAERRWQRLGRERDEALEALQGGSAERVRPVRASRAAKGGRR